MNDDRPMARGSGEERPRPDAREVVDAAKERVATHAAAATGGAIAGAAAGAIGGTAAGPIGSLVGAVGGAIAGAAAGASTGDADSLDTREFEAWWREHFAERPYVHAGSRYDDYASAYRFGIRHYAQTDHPRSWEQVCNELRHYWAQERGGSRMSWDDAMPAVRDAWRRMYDPATFE